MSADFLKGLLDPPDEQSVCFSNTTKILKNLDSEGHLGHFMMMMMV